jgi:diacylglycerol kinase (ATP)
VNEPMRLGVIVNPTAGRGAGKAEGAKAIALFKAAGIAVVDLTGADIEEANANARHAINDKQVDGIVVVGGDGIAHLGVNLCAGTDLPLGMIGAGTGNDLPRSIGMPLNDTAGSVEIILAHLNNPRTVDAVKAQTSTSEFWFFGTISAGFDALVNQRANRWRWPKGPSRYTLAMLAELASFKPIHYEATIDGEHRSFQAMLCAVANSESFGGGMRVAPNAIIDDGLLELFIVHSISRPEFIKVFPKVFTGEHIHHPAVEIIQAKHVKISSGNMPAYSDGEAVGFSPVSAQIMPGSLRVFAPQPA